jgi:hypothetical protein
MAAPPRGNSPQRAGERVTGRVESASQTSLWQEGSAQMADHKHGNMDIKEQEKTFNGFMKWTANTVIVILLLIVFMAIFIT